ncbi:MAG: MBL fold metallo-hydrolase [Anaerolineae bacterium]|nr:MBL fold metallo-hydrolase [Anaerolineae bacterium]
MLLKYFYDDKLAHASYMVGCQRTGEAVIIDAGRDVQQYLDAATKEEMRIVGAADTHIHADYVSGARELAERVGAKLYVSDEGDENWKYEFAAAYNHQLLKDGDIFTIGNIKFETFYSPGHTPEHISFILTDMGGGADKPMGIFTGDFIFVGSIGRPDLLEKAAGIGNTAVPGAYQQFESIQRFKQLPDYLQVWPAHGAGSACGKGLGAIPSTTVGYEKMFNPMLQYDNPSEFVEALLDGQPEAPRYFAVMKKVNKEGPEVLGERPLPDKLAVTELEPLLAADQMVLDTRSDAAFAQAHLPGSLNISLKNLAVWSGWLVDYHKPLYLISTPSELAEAVRVLAKVGIDNVVGYFDANEVAAAGLMSQSYEVKRPQEVAEQILSGRVTLLDIRAESEWNEARLPNACHIMLGYLPQRADEVINGNPIVVLCRTGNRSAIAASLLQAQGAQEVINLAGGIVEWQQAGLPVER